MLRTAASPDAFISTITTKIVAAKKYHFKKKSVMILTRDSCSIQPVDGGEKKKGHDLVPEKQYTVELNQIRT